MTEYQLSGFGETLRSRREQLGLSLNDVAVRTRVRKAYLQALEEENLAALPGSAYAIGFLRIYAKHMGLAVEPLAVALTGKSDPGGERKLLTSGEGGGAVAKLVIIVPTPGPQAAVSLECDRMSASSGHSRPVTGRSDLHRCVALGGGVIPYLTIAIYSPPPKSPVRLERH